jgi:hypothetical protein
MRNAIHGVLRCPWPLWAAIAVSVASPAWAACPTGQVACGTSYCIPARQTCCDSVGHPDKYCASGRACNTDGQTCLGSALACAAGYAAGISSCGTDVCACAVSCTTNSGCSTNCCAAPANDTGTKYCAPSCVCQGSGSLVLYCDAVNADGGVTDGGAKDGGVADGGAKDGGATDGGTDASVRLDGGGGGHDAGTTLGRVSRDPFGQGCNLGGGGLAGLAGAALVLLVVLGWGRRQGRRE